MRHYTNCSCFDHCSNKPRGYFLPFSSEKYGLGPLHSTFKTAQQNPKKKIFEAELIILHISTQRHLKCRMFEQQGVKRKNYICSAVRGFFCCGGDEHLFYSIIITVIFSFSWFVLFCKIICQEKIPERPAFRLRLGRCFLF